MKPAGFSGPKGLLEPGYRSELLGVWAPKQVTFYHDPLQDLEPFRGYYYKALYSALSSDCLYMQVVVLKAIIGEWT